MTSSIKLRAIISISTPRTWFICNSDTHLSWSSDCWFSFSLSCSTVASNKSLCSAVSPHSASRLQRTSASTTVLVSANCTRSRLHCSTFSVISLRKKHYISLINRNEWSKLTVIQSLVVRHYRSANRVSGWQAMLTLCSKTVKNNTLYFHAYSKADRQRKMH